MTSSRVTMNSAVATTLLNRAVITTLPALRATARPVVAPIVAIAVSDELHCTMRVTSVSPSLSVASAL
jgi:hypothetical protein